MMSKMSQGNASTSQSRRTKLQKDHEIIKQTLRDKQKVNTDQQNSTDEVSRALMKFLQYRSKSSCMHKDVQKDVEAQIKVFAFNLYCSKPQIYSNLKSILGLPDESVFHNFKINLSPEIDDSKLYFLSSKLNSLRPEMNHFVLCVEEIKLNRNLVYDTKRDVILGFHNISGSVNNLCASFAFVLLLRSTKMDWALPVAYGFLSETTNWRNNVVFLCIKVVAELLQVGIQVDAIITRQSVMTQASDKNNLHSDTLDCYTYKNNKKVYELYDIHYMILQVRNCLIGNDFFVNDSRISWHYIKLLFHHQRDYLGSSLIPEITSAHVCPVGSQRSRLKNAVELFSMNVYHALNQLIKTGALPEQAQATADFVKIMSELCNIVTYSPNPANKKNNINHQIKVLKCTLEMFNNIRENNFVALAITNMRKTLRVLTILLRDWKQQGMKHVYMSRLNKAPLDTFVRNIPRIVKNGKRLRPTASQVVTAFRNSFIQGMRRPLSAGAQREDLSAAARGGLLDAGRAPAAAAPRAAPLQLPFPPRDYRIRLTRTVAVDEVYIASFLLSKCIQIHSCVQLHDYLHPKRYFLDSDIHKMLNRSCDFDRKLVIPPAAFVKYVSRLMKLYPPLMRANGTGTPGRSVVLGLSRRPPPLDAVPCPCFPFQLLLKIFVRMQIWDAINYTNQKLRASRDRCGLVVPRLLERRCL